MKKLSWLLVLAMLVKLLEYERSTDDERDYSSVKQMDILKDDYVYIPVRPSNVVDIFSYRANMAK